MSEHAGVYISVPFCRAKCTYCNFASGVFGEERMDAYVDRVCAEIEAVRNLSTTIRAELPDRVDTIFLGGGTPSLLSAAQMARLFRALRGEFQVAANAEVTLECAPGQLGDETLDEMLRLGFNRVSFGVQSFVDAETRAVGRLHTRDLCLAEIQRMRAAGLPEINVDLIAGLPAQTAASWRESVDVTIAADLPHVSLYMLEVDEDSRLGREMLDAGARYGAATTASEDETADRYAAACEWLEAAGLRQYEISNFASDGHASRHNTKYWRREAYVGFGLDAHSMLRLRPAEINNAERAVRWANTDDLDAYLSEDGRFIRARSPGLSILPQAPAVRRIGREEAFEEAMFLGLRMNEGLRLDALRMEFGASLVDGAMEALADAVDAGLACVARGRVMLTARGRMASNEVFSRLLVEVA